MNLKDYKVIEIGENVIKFPKLILKADVDKKNLDIGMTINDENVILFHKNRYYLGEKFTYLESKNLNNTVYSISFNYTVYENNKPFKDITDILKRQSKIDKLLDK